MSDFTVHLERATECCKSSQFDQALRELEVAFKKAPDEQQRADTLFMQVDCLIQLHRTPEARERFKMAVGMLPDTEAAREQADFYEVDLLVTEGQQKEALRKLERLSGVYAPFVSQSKEYRKHWESIEYRRGIILGRLERFDEAFPILEMALSFDDMKDDPEFHYLLARCHLNRQENDRAKQRLLQGLVTGVSTEYEVPIRFLLGVAHYRLGAFAWALQEFLPCEQHQSELNVNGEVLQQWLTLTRRALDKNASS